MLGGKNGLHGANFNMAENSPDEFATRLHQLLTGPPGDPVELQLALRMLNDRYLVQQKLLDRVVRISDGFQRAERERTVSHHARYEREIRRIEKIIRISDSYQSMSRASERHYRDVFNHAPLAFLLFDRQGHVLDWNRTAEQIFGWRRDEVLGQDVIDFLVPESECARMRGLLEETLVQGEATHSISANLTKSGETVICEWSNVLRFNSDGELVGVLSLVMDISERFRLENDLRIAKESAEQALEDQRQFLAMASHEFRSPLAVIDSAAQLLELGFRAHPDAVRGTQRIRRAVKRLSGFLENCLTEDRLDTRHWQLAGSEFVLPDLIAAVVEQAGLVSARHCIEVLDAGMPQVFYGDPPLLEVMLHNLLENAVKYSPQGGCINLRLGCNPQGALTICVSDQGVGIAPDELPRIFSKYMRGRGGGGVSGAGLGLYLVARIVALHHGRIEVFSVPGEGARFEVILPAMADGGKLIPEVGHESS